MRFQLKTLLWIVTGCVILLGLPLAMVGRFGDIWWHLLLSRLFDQLWYLPIFVVCVVGAALIWKNRAKNPDACRLALLGIGIQLAMFYLNYVYNLWLEAVPRLDPSAWNNMDESLGVMPYLYVGAELIGAIATSVLLLRAFLLALNPSTQSSPN